MWGGGTGTYLLSNPIQMAEAALLVDARYESQLNAAVLKSVDIIGMTTTGAASLSRTLRALEPEVVVIEEAAAVLEAHIASVLTPATQHLILIGDHQQLRPAVTEYTLAQCNALDVSLFERLVVAGAPHVTLSSQRRMHPEIAELITPTIYPTLASDPSTLTRPSPRGMFHRVFFWDHAVNEDGANGDGSPVTKVNSHEAVLAVHLAQYLLLQGYAAKQLVLLTMYQGQVVALRKEAAALSRSNGVFGGLLAAPVSAVRIVTTDNCT